MTKFLFVGSYIFEGVENCTINSINSLVKVHFNVIAYILREENQKAKSYSQGRINHKAYEERGHIKAENGKVKA